MKIYYITRAYVGSSTDSYNNCSGLRNHYVDLLREKYNVTVITPNYSTSESLISDELIRFPYQISKKDMVLETLGIKEDYLDSWSEQVSDYLINNISDGDLIFSTIGGELAGIKIAYKVKLKRNVHSIINFRDPVNYTKVYGKYTGGKKTKIVHVKRDEMLKKYLSNVDYIITSSNSYKELMVSLLPEKKNHIINNYFGYSKKIEAFHRKLEDKLVLAYAGTMTNTQGAECFIVHYAGINGVDIKYIGTPTKRIKKLSRKYTNVEILPPMEHKEYLRYMQEKVDIGLVSLMGNQYGACVPSKIYELINLCKPILAILPDGDAKDIINKNGYGLACGVNELELSRCNLNALKEVTYFNSVVSNMERDKDKWHSDKLINEVYPIIDKLSEKK